VCLPAAAFNSPTSKFLQTPVRWNAKHPQCASLDGKFCWKDTTIPCAKVREPQRISGFGKKGVEGLEGDWPNHHSALVAPVAHVI